MRNFASLIAMALPVFSPAALAQSLCNPCVDPPTTRPEVRLERAPFDRFRPVAPAVQTDRSAELASEGATELAAAADAESAWMDLPYAERDSRFQREGRDVAWATSMESAITQKIADWSRPPVQLVSAECRVTLCRISMFWPEDSSNGDRGQQLSTLYGLGIDHQGETRLLAEANGYLWTVIARRR